VVALNRAVVLAETEGASAALSIVDTLDLDTYVPFHVVRADLLEQLGDAAEAVAAYDRAIELTTNAPERAFLEGRRDALA
jgi:RNA polymerase sigma-70 factor (ECF subfamily)